ncbi:MAG TPA: hypothetical protein ENJ35_10525 [Gammaproteobacteria bacterium]|nr:hypothetical protein [Gammaproteobacteria bacterium]
MGIYLLLIGSWLLFFAIHSLTASHRFKAWVSDCCPWLIRHYRLLYNLFASVTVLIPLAIFWLHPGPVLWQWQGFSWYLMNLLALLAIAGFAISSRYYDMAAFLGLRKHHHGALTAADEPFSISPFHRYVRHPWYFFGLLLVWTRDMPLSWFITCVLATLYFILGSQWEEKKLIVDYGERYRHYRQRVPALIPLPWKYLTADEARELSQE